MPLMRIILKGDLEAEEFNDRLGEFINMCLCYPESAGAAKYLGWDLERNEMLEQTVKNTCAAAPFVTLALLRDEPLAFAWANPISSECAQIHFAPARPWLGSYIELAGRICIQSALAKWHTLLAIIPAPFVGAARLARKLGMKKLALIPRFCDIRSMNKIRDGALYMITRKDAAMTPASLMPFRGGGPP